MLWSSADGVRVRSMKQSFELAFRLEPPRSARNSAIVWSGLPRLQSTSASGSSATFNVVAWLVSARERLVPVRLQLSGCWI